MMYERSLPYQPGQTKPYKLSRSRIDLFVDCPRCFWLQERLKIKRPDFPPFQINKAIDELLKKEFDIYRSKSKPHPLMLEFGVRATPYRHKYLEDWRNNFTGIQHLDVTTNLLIFGAIDDIWESDTGELHVVDYKATAKNKDITELDPVGGWHDSYRRQIEIYQWLFRRNEFKVSNTGYFVYANGQANESEFGNVVKFKTNIIAYEGDDSWISQKLNEIKKCLEGDIPSVGNGPLGDGCVYCAYSRNRTQLTLDAISAKKTN